MFGQVGVRSRRFTKLKLTVESLPDLWEPVRVIETAKYLLVLNDKQSINNSQLGKIKLKDEGSLARSRVLGTYTINQQQMEKLKQLWHTSNNNIVAATDGGLKESMGTSSYALFFPDDPVEIVKGYAGEYQPKPSASSTRQELLGQLGVEYWLEDLANQWGRPRNSCRMVLVTDSQSSIDIMKNIPQGIGIRDMLKPELDVGLELYETQLTNSWVYRRVEKVVSHIELDDAPNEFYWGCNCLADEMATRARHILKIENLQGIDHHVLKGTQVGCKIDGRIENNNLHNTIKEHIQGRELKFFLMEKYGWPDHIFMDIGWVAHQRELTKYPRLQRCTLVKYIHGWLATKRRRSRIGSVLDATCPLCGEEETRQHLFECSNARYRGIRQDRLTQLMKDIGDITVPGCREVFQIGLATVLGSEPPTEITQRDWPETLRRAYFAQGEIGWIHVLYGRISKQWEILANPATEAGQNGNFQWTCKVVRLCWRFGLVLWKVRNDLVHGTDGSISQLEQQRLRSLIALIYQKQHVFGDSRKWTEFPSDETVVLKWSYDTQMAFVERLKYLYPDAMKQIESARDQFGGSH